jgi:uncharacterized damage-inducible protein DinB
MRDWLLTAFQYDLWANRIWLDRVGPNPVMDHVLGAQQIWLRRLGVEAELDMAALNEGFRSVVASRDMDEAVEYRTMKGVPLQQTVAEILLQVINHGTYHRGQLRGQIQGDDVPDTDLILFLIARDAK